MNYLGSIGHVMAGSGLTEALQCCYGPIAITHMMTGKTVARALRGHFLAESALFALLLESILKMEFLTTSDIDDLSVSDRDANLT